jgi:hypothetical protein
MLEMSGMGWVCVGFSVLCVTTAAYYISAEWFKTRQAQIEADLKREMIQKGLPPDEIERVLNTHIRAAE